MTQHEGQGSNLSPEDIRREQFANLIEAHDRTMARLTEVNALIEPVITAGREAHAQLGEALTALEQSRQVNAEAHALLGQTREFLQASGIDTSTLATPHTDENKKNWLGAAKEKAGEWFTPKTRRTIRLGATAVGALAAGGVAAGVAGAESNVDPGVLKTVVKTAPAQPTSADKARYAHAEDAKSVPGYVKRLMVTKKNVMGDVRYTFSPEHKADKSDHTSSTDAMSSMIQFHNYGGGGITADKLLVAYADTVDSNNAYMHKEFKVRHGDLSEGPTPTDPKVIAHERKSLEDDILNHIKAYGIVEGKDLKDRIFRNHGQHAKIIYSAGNVKVGRHQKVFIVELDDGTILTKKLFEKPGGRLCMNSLTQSTTTPNVKVTLTPPPPTETVTTTVPTTTTETTTTTVPTTTTQTVTTTVPTTPTVLTTPKTDTDSAPANQVTEPPASPDNPTIPVAPPAKTTPSTLTNEAPPTGPAETGTDGGPTQTVTPSNHTGQTIPVPTTTFDPQG